MDKEIMIEKKRLIAPSYLVGTRQLGAKALSRNRKMMKLPKKNVILITIDALRADHLNCLGYPRKTTSNLDEFAHKGALFTHAFSNAPTTRQSFPSILTSTYAAMYNDCALQDKRPLSKERMTIAEKLKEYGYSTAGFHYNAFLSSLYGYDRGFDTFEDFLGESLKIRKHTFIQTMFRKTLRKPGKLPFVFRELGKIITRSHGSRARDRRVGVPYKRASVISRKALDWLKNKQPKSFFLWLHYMDTHIPYIPPKDFTPPSINWWTLDKLQSKFSRALIYDCSILSNNDLVKLVSLYDGEIEYVDHIFGLFLSELEKIGIGLDNTFFIITADHGDEFMEHGGLSHSGKLYDELIHVPLILCGPGIKRNTVVKDLVSLIDLAPTILTLLDTTKVPETFMGRSLHPIWNAKKSTESMGIISEWTKGKRRRVSYRTNEWKYILTLDEKDTQHELYDLQTDPKERKDLSGEEKMRCAKFKTKLTRHISMEEKSRTKERIRTLKRKGII